MLAKLNIRSGVLVVLLGLLINNAFSKTVDLGFENDNFEKKDSLLVLKNDSLKPDSLRDPDISPNGPTNRVKYIAKDSIDFDNANQIVYLFGESKVEYGEISLEADRIIVYIGKNEVHAFGLRDSTGKLVEKVKFNDKDGAFEAPEMAYNFNTKKGRIIQATTQEGEMYLLSDVGKKMPNNDIFLKKGKITTCDAEHPHFYFEATKLKVIPGKKIVVGPTNLIIRELRTPIVIPFGMFPNNQKKQSGILIPGFASGSFGYGLEELGFHWAINDYIHADFFADMYFSGTHRLTGEFNYKKRYKYNGKVWFKYNNVVSGTKDLADHTIKKDFNLKWTYNQAAQAHPKRTFSVAIDAKTPTFNQTQVLSNTTANFSTQSFNRSSMNWRWNEKRWNINMNASLDQNFTNKTIKMVLPTMTMNVNPIKYKKLSLSGNIVAGNETTRGDSVFLENETFNHLRNGARANFKLNLTERWTLAKYINITTPSFSWNSYFITEEISKIQGVAGLENDTMGVYKHAYDMSLGNFGLNTKIFGTYKFKPGMYIKGFRHTITPSASITWRPDWFMEQQNINDTITDVISGRFTEYSKYSTAMYRPNASKAATVNLSLDQNLQTKTRDRNDSTGTKYNNINLINAFRVNTSYNFLRDSMRWNNLGFVLNTTPGFLKILNVQGSISPYAMDDEGYAYDSLLWRAGQLGRLTSFRIQTEIKLARLNFSNWIYGQKESPKDDFKWNVNLRYTYNYSKPGLDPTINQSLEVRGDVSLTKDWSFQYSLPVNIEDGSFSQMGYINFKRNLHCWEMTFNYFPFQEDTWYTFTIRPKSGILQDLKYDKNRRGDRLY